MQFVFLYHWPFEELVSVALFGRSDIQSQIRATMQSELFGVVATVPLGFDAISAKFL